MASNIESAPREYALNDPKIINGWALFDWANSAFALVITAAIFPAYFTGITDDQITFGGMNISNSGLYAFATSFSYLVISVLSPILSGIADYGGKRKFFLRFFTTLGSIACLSLFFFEGMSTLAIGVLGYILSMIGFGAGLVFYNSYLPDIVTEDQYDRVSAKGFSMGYIGSVLLLIINLVIISFPATFGFEEGSTLPVRLAFLMVGLWWIGFAQISFRALPEDSKDKPSSDLIKKGYLEIVKVWNQVRSLKNIKKFLSAFFCYSAGVQTIIYLAAIFGEKELKMGASELIVLILLLQILAIGGAYLFAKVSDIKGNKFSLIIMLFIWMGICIFAFFVDQKWQFYTVAGMVGLVMGGIQSLSRSTYSKLIPENTEDTTSFFSFYDVLEKVAVVAGTFVFGYLDLITGGMRNSILALSLFFALGIVLLWKVEIKKGGEIIN